MAKKKRPTIAERQNNTRGYGLARDVQAGQARPVRIRRRRVRPSINNVMRPGSYNRA